MTSFKLVFVKLLLFFKLYLAKPCAPIEDDSSISTETDCLYDVKILAVNFKDQDTLLTHMMKICDSAITIVLPLPIVFCNSLNSGIFPGNWKR